MPFEAQADKVEAIYKLREAAERKVLAEVAAERDPSPQARHALLDAKLALEAKTQDAIEVCHDCEHQHAASEPHNVPRANGDDPAPRGNVVDVDFRKGRDPGEREDR